MVAMIQGIPIPRKTLTEFDPVTFPMAESAYYELLAACILAKVSGRDVPMATRVIPVTAGLRLMTQPKTVATSPTRVVIIPMIARATRNEAHPPQIWRGGTTAPTTFQNMETNCQIAEPQPTSSTIKLS